MSDDRKGRFGDEVEYPEPPPPHWKARRQIGGLPQPEEGAAATLRVPVSGCGNCPFNDSLSGCGFPGLSAAESTALDLENEEFGGVPARCPFKKYNKGVTLIMGQAP